MQEQRSATVNTVAASILVAFFKAPELAALDFRWCGISTMVPLLHVDVEDPTALGNPSEGKLLGTGGHLGGVGVGSDTFGTCVNIEKVCYSYIKKPVHLICQFVFYYSPYIIPNI